MLRLKVYLHPREVIAYAVCACNRIVLRRADVEDLLAESGVISAAKPFGSGAQ